MDVAKPDDTLVLLVDAQPEFLRQMHGPQEPVLARLERLLQLAEMLDLPVIATFERPTEKKGLLPERLESAFPASGRRLEKCTFDCTADEGIRDALADVGRPNVAVAGSETDVCVLFSVLGLLRTGYRVWLLEDCTFTSEPRVRPALDRMYAAGAVPCTYKTLAYELTATVDRSTWPAEWRARLEEAPHLFPPPEDLPESS